MVNQTGPGIVVHLHSPEVNLLARLRFRADFQNTLDLSPGLEGDVGAGFELFPAYLGISVRRRSDNRVRRSVGRDGEFAVGAGGGLGSLPAALGIDFVTLIAEEDLCAGDGVAVGVADGAGDGLRLRRGRAGEIGHGDRPGCRDRRFGMVLRGNLKRDGGCAADDCGGDDASGDDFQFRAGDEDGGGLGEGDAAFGDGSGGGAGEAGRSGLDGAAAECGAKGIGGGGDAAAAEDFAEFFEAAGDALASSFGGDAHHLAHFVAGFALEEFEHNREAIALGDLGQGIVKLGGHLVPIG